ncbi:MAG TPA: UDP-N-acetylmuramoyl-L-alanyl-D-glutamate--2,6-diaminopimelate ligase [Propionibacteriaceae bacterium]
MPHDPSVTALRPRNRHVVSLSDLFPGVDLGQSGGRAAGVSGITLDSRLVSHGDLYVALPGRHHHGAAFSQAAVAAGAVAVLTDPTGGRAAGVLPTPVIVVDDPRQAMAGVAARIYGEPARTMSMFAVTGTNGKTTTTFLLEAALRASGHATGLIGTIGFRLNGVPLVAARTTVTTPESPELQALLGYLAQEGADAVLMEVSSHALVLGRADAIVFDVAAFTNFGRDHLDFHGDEESYFEAKASLFTAERTRRAVINIDDPRGAHLVKRLRQVGEVEVWTVSLSDDADYRALAYAVGADGRTEVRARLRGRSLDFRLALPGDFNVRNALTALAMVDLTTDPASDELERAAVGLTDATVPGRMERVELGPGAPIVYVDFAHTPQAVAAALGAVGHQRRIAVFGCGGDRDPHKRELMGAAAARTADVVIVTDDNPRSEDAATIRAQVMAGARTAVSADGLDTVLVDGGDRTSAIRHALELAEPGDVVALLGKGHEDGQELADRMIPFRDADVAAEQWSRLAAEREAPR